MEAQPAGGSQGKKSRSNSDADRIKPNFSSNDGAEGLPRDPIYPDQSPSSLNTGVGDSMEGFAGSNNTGMNSPGNTENFGSSFQMPDNSTSDNFLNSPDVGSQASRQGASGSQALTGAQGLGDIQSSLAAIQDLIERIRMNLQSSEQEELEALLRQGAEILSGNWKQLSSYSTQNISTLKSEVKENPYKGLIAALKIGMAISHIYTSRKHQGSYPGAHNEVI